MPDKPEVIAPEKEQSAIGNLSDPEDGKVLLPPFIAKRAGGLFVIAANIGSPTDFHDFAEKVFASGTFFRELDYERFVSLVYDDGVRTADTKPEIHFAADIVSFNPDRKAIYTPVQIENGEASFMFQPVFIQSTIETPVSGELEDGSTGVIRNETHTTSSRTMLDADEFVAVLWEQGVRYGIDMAAVRSIIKKGATEKMIVARPRPCQPGTDAEIRELSDDMHRSNAPRLLADGKADLHQFQNRYPQVKEGKRLLKKTPRILGVNGRDIAGDLIEPPIPADVDLGSRVGAGTTIIIESDGEYLVATTSGFLDDDDPSKPFSVVNKIINKDGVSLSTTGNLTLTVDEYEVHGEIQEQCLLECRSITAFADVYGDILSHGDIVCLKRNLSGGSATNDKGDILVEGLAVGSTLIAHKGTITLARAENCVVIGHTVKIENARCCDIIADSVNIGTAEGCAIAGKLLHLAKSCDHSEVDTVLTVLIPETAGYVKQIDALRATFSEIAPALADLQAKRDALHNQVKGYLGIKEKLKRKEMKLTEKQLADFKAHSIQADPIIFSLSLANEEVAVLEKKSTDISQEIERLSAVCSAASAGVSCLIEAVDGETQVRTLALKSGAAPLSSLPVKELKSRLRATDFATPSLFSGDSGSFSWEFGVPSLLD